MAIQLISQLLPCIGLYVTIYPSYIPTISQLSLPIPNGLVCQYRHSWGIDSCRAPKKVGSPGYASLGNKQPMN